MMKAATPLRLNVYETRGQVNTSPHNPFVNNFDMPVFPSQCNLLKYNDLYFQLQDFLTLCPAPCCPIGANRS
jgi:hypothetical protein